MFTIVDIGCLGGGPSKPIETEQFRIEPMGPAGGQVIDHQISISLTLQPQHLTQQKGVDQWAIAGDP